MNESYIVDSDGKVYQDEFQLTMGRPLPDPFEQDRPEKNQPSDENIPKNLSQDASEAAAARTKQSVKPEGGRQEGGTTKVLAGYLEHALNQVGTIPQRTIEAASKFAETGEYDPAPAVEAAMMLYGVNAPFVPKNALGAFGGIWARTADVNNLHEAQAMSRAGKHPMVVYQETGWYMGHDGKWKFEIPDQQVTTKQPKNLDDIDINPLYLNDLLEHPKLFEAYPQLKDIRIKPFDPDLNRVGYADLKEIGLNSDLIKNGEVTVGGEVFTLKNVLLHEIQHMIQKKEGFAKGAAWATQNDLAKDHPWAAEIKEQIDRGTDLWENKAKELGREPKVSDFNESEKEMLRKINKIYKTWNEMRKVGEQVAVENYLKTAGEVESRNVERRAEQPERFNKIVPPFATEMVPANVQIISPEVTYYTPYGQKGEGR